jgi:hypothetical protein
MFRNIIASAKQHKKLQIFPLYTTFRAVAGALLVIPAYQTDFNRRIGF